MASVSVLFAASFAAAQAPTRLEFSALLQRLRADAWLYAPPLAGERCVQFSSHDRASDRGPADASAWYANDDRGHYLRTVAGTAGAEYVLAECDGPGCIARLWSANPSGTLHFDIDGQRVWSVDFALLCSGKLAGVPEPLAGIRARGATCYLPVPFGKRLVLSATAGDLYYTVDVVRWSSTVAVAGFDPTLLSGQCDAVTALAKELGQAHPVWMSPRQLPCAVPEQSVVEALSVSASGAATPAERDDVLARTRLVIRAGDELLVDVPLPAFFAAGQGWRPWRSRYLAISAQGEAKCEFPMPFPHGGTIELYTEGETLGVTFAVGLGVASVSLPDDTRLFRAGYHLVKDAPTRPFSEQLVLDAKGAGRFVGCSLLVRNASRIWWGEGDEKIWVDGEAQPSWFGTGTEDYFGYGWCDPTPFEAPFHAQVECDGPMNFGFTQLHRTHVLDSVPFAQSLRFTLERWHWVEDMKMDYATVAYWYGAPGARSGLPSVPDAAIRALSPLAGPPMFVATDALEGEALRVVSCSGGEHTVQDVGVFQTTFSRDAHRWWRDGKVGDALVLAVPVPVAGRYRVTAAFVEASDFGIVRFVLANRPLGEPFDGFAERVQSSGPRDLGTATLPAGEVELRLELVGANAAAKPGMMVGLDYLRLEKLP